MLNDRIRLIAFPNFLFLFLILFTHAFAGEGFLERENDQWVLHLKGTPYERGYQHGTLLKEQIQRNISEYIDKSKSQVVGRPESFIKSIPNLLTYVPDHFMEEMQGLSDGSGVPINKIILLNLFPEMFHCSGITVVGDASKDGELYHVRVLDYSIGRNLQSTAVLQVVEPDEGIPFLNVTYAGFIGTVTGMNNEKIAIGEIGGQGYGSWDGIPMAFLLRDILQYASSIEEAKTILQTSPRTCEYYYVFSDGKTNESIGVYATADQLKYFIPGESYALLAPSNLPSNYGEDGNNDKFVHTSYTLESTPYQTLMRESDGRLSMLFRLQPKDCLFLTGFPHPERYPALIDRALEKYGAIDADALIEIIKQPVARPSNLHNAIFKPAELKVWISHAGPDNEPACDQPYSAWDLPELLSRP